MSTAKPQRTKAKPAQAKAPHEHKWELSTDPDFQHCPGCGSYQRMVCDYQKHTAFADLLAACEAILVADHDALWADKTRGKVRITMTAAIGLVRAAIAKAKPS